MSNNPDETTMTVNGFTWSMTTGNPWMACTRCEVLTEGRAEGKALCLECAMKRALGVARMVQKEMRSLL